MSPKIDTLLCKDSKEEFDYGNWVKDLGKRIWGAPAQITEQITKATEKK
jgi:hypothetical protein